MTPDQLDNALRSALAADPRSDNQIAKDSGVPQSIVSRFRNEGASIRLDNASKIAAALGLELRKRKGAA